MDFCSSKGLYFPKEVLVDENVLLKLTSPDDVNNLLIRLVNKRNKPASNCVLQSQGLQDDCAVGANM